MSLAPVLMCVFYVRTAFVGAEVVLRLLRHVIVFAEAQVLQARPANLLLQFGRRIPAEEPLQSIRVRREVGACLGRRGCDRERKDRDCQTDKPHTHQVAPRLPHVIPLREG
jgi:hypothetical protein